MSSYYVLGTVLGAETVNSEHSSQSLFLLGVPGVFILWGKADESNKLVKLIVYSRVIIALVGGGYKVREAGGVVIVSLSRWHLRVKKQRGKQSVSVWVGGVVCREECGRGNSRSKA